MIGERMEILVGNQYTFSNVTTPKRLMEGVYEVTNVSVESDIVVLNQMTKSGVVSQDVTRKFTVSFKFMEQFATALDMSERVYPVFPALLNKLTEYIAANIHTFTPLRKLDAKHALDVHVLALNEKINALQEELAKIDAVVKTLGDLSPEK